jgi:hypothetical protein
MLVQDLLLFKKYGPTLVDDSEYRRYLDVLAKRYYHMLAKHAVSGYGRDFWEFQARALGWIGWRIDRGRLAWGIAKQVADRVLNPKRTLEQLLQPGRK